MTDNTRKGITTLVATLLEDMKSLLAELPFLDDKPVDYDGIKQQFDSALDILGIITEKSNTTHVLVQSVINSIHSSRVELKDSVDGLLKKTGDQLSKITATTEDATNKILDEAMKLDGDQNVIMDKLNEYAKLAGTDEGNETLAQIKQMVMDNQDSVFNIIQHLQFQDITAQQIKGAYALLADTERTLLYVANMLKEFDTGDGAFEITLPELDKNAFNEDAVFGDTSNLQDAINDLFNTGDVNIEIPKHEMDGKKVTPDSGGSGAAADDDFDIDALFSGGNPDSGKADQNDIDKLFS